MNRSGPAAWPNPAVWFLRWRDIRLDTAVLLVTALVVAAAVGWNSPLRAQSTTGSDVPGWRKDGSGIFPSARPPTHWSSDNTSEKNVLWKIKLPGRSISSPIAVKGHVLTTAEPAELICVNANDGQILWQRSHSYRDVFGDEKGSQIERNLEQAKQLQERIKQRKREAANKEEPSEEAVAEQQEQIAMLQEQYDSLTQPYPPAPSGRPGNTTATPVSDGKRVWAVYGTGIVSSHTLDGERNWMKFIEAPGDRHSTSPLLVDGLLIVHLRDLVALTADTGEVVWRTASPSRAGTPVVVRCGSSKVIVTPAGAVVQVRDGKILSEGLFNLAYCSPIADGSICYAFENGKTTALRLEEGEGETDEVQAQTVWESRGAGDHRLGSPVYQDGLLYAATKEGILEVIDAETGERVYRKRLDLGKGRVDPSLAVAGGHLYVSSHQGVTLVVAPGREFEEIARNELESFSSSPVFHKDRLYIRAGDHLYAIGK